MGRFNPVFRARQVGQSLVKAPVQWAKVQAINASPVAAYVVDLNAIGNRTELSHVGEAMCIYVICAGADSGAELNVTLAVGLVAYDHNAIGLHRQMRDPFELEGALLPAALSLGGLHSRLVISGAKWRKRRLAHFTRSVRAPGERTMVRALIVASASAS